MVYNVIIIAANTSNDYLSIEHNFDHNCQARGICTSPLNTTAVTSCSITYRNNASQVLHDLNVSINEQFIINNILNADYFEAVIALNHSEINEVHLKSNFIVGQYL